MVTHTCGIYCFYPIVNQDDRSLLHIYVQTAEPQIIRVLHEYDNLEHLGEYDHTQIESVKVGVVHLLKVHIKVQLAKI